MKRVKFWVAMLALAGILVRPEAAVSGAQRAMRLWCTSVAPALFPFLALMPILTGAEACAAYNAAFSRAMRPLFGLPGAAAPAVIIGMISGSPGGALAVRRVAAESGMHSADARRVALALCGISPAYLILGVGQGLYGSVSLGVRLALIQAGIQLALLALLRGAIGGNGDVALRAAEERSRNPVGMAVERVLVVCGYMVLFSAVACVAASFLGEHLGTALLLAADLPSGLAELARWEIPGKMLIQGMAIGFGGLCIAAQNLDVLRAIGVEWREYLAVRSIAATLFACISGLMLRARESGAEQFVGNAGRAYAFSLLAAGIVALPGLIYLSYSMFLNNRKRDCGGEKGRSNAHI